MAAFGGALPRTGGECHAVLKTAAFGAANDAVPLGSLDGSRAGKPLDVCSYCGKSYR